MAEPLRPGRADSWTSLKRSMAQHAAEAVRETRNASVGLSLVSFGYKWATTAGGLKCVRHGGFAARMKKRGQFWLGHTTGVKSYTAYSGRDGGTAGTCRAHAAHCQKAVSLIVLF